MAQEVGRCHVGNLLYPLIENGARHTELRCHIVHTQLGIADILLYICEQSVHKFLVAVDEFGCF